MIFEREYKPELCVSTNGTRQNLIHVELDVDGKRLMATDGHMLAIVPCIPDEHDVSGPITVGALKAARKASRTLPPTIVANGALAIPASGVTYLRPVRDEHMRFPPVDQVMPRADRPCVRIGLNPTLLLRLAQAIGKAECVELRIATDADGGLDALAPIAVVGLDGAIGVLMPCRV